MENSTSSESTTHSQSLHQSSSRNKLFEDINQWLRVYYSMFLIITGTALNILSILTLSRKSFRRSTTSVYLRFLAVVDLFSLYNGAGRHFITGAFHYNIRAASEAFCKFNQWSTSFGPDISAWILVAVTAERVLSIVKPHSVRLMCTKFTARITILGIVLVLMATNLPLLIFYGDQKVYDEASNTTETKRCVLVRAVTFMGQVWYWLDLVKFVLLPSALLTTFNVIIVSAIARRHRNLNRVPRRRQKCSPPPSWDSPPGEAASPGGRQGGAGENGNPPVSVYCVAADHVSLVAGRTNGGTRPSGEDVNHPGSAHHVTKEHPDLVVDSSAANGAKAPGLTVRRGSSRVVYKVSSVDSCNGRNGENNSKLSGAFKGSKSRVTTSNNSLTITLVVVNATFVVCNTPVMVFLLNRNGWFRPDQGAAKSLTWTVVVMAMYTNNALNFLLYCASGSKFRAEMRAMFTSCRSLPQSSAALRGRGQVSRYREHSGHCTESSDVSTQSTSVPAMSFETSPRS